MAPSPALPRPAAALSAAARRVASVAFPVAGALALIVSEFLTLRVIKTVTVVPTGGTTTGGPHHGYALLVLGVASLPMAFGAVFGASRPAAAAVLALGAVALAIVLAVDLPTLDDTGLIGETYDLARAHPGAGFWVELAGSVVLLVSGALLLRSRVALARERSASRRRARQPAA